jgi:flagellar biosynthetic protein FlhB
MAEDKDDAEKTEDPTQKKLDDALEQGDVAKSQEVSTWFIMAGATLTLMVFSNGMGHDLSVMMRGLMINSYQIRVDAMALPQLYQTIGLKILAVLAVPVLLLMLAALAGNMVQHRLVWSAKSLQPKLSKISPAAGLKRMFSVQSVANLVKGIVKMIVLGVVLTALIWPERDRIMALERADPVAILPLAHTLALKIMGAVVSLLAIMAVADFLFQYRRWYQKQKMSLRDIKDEFKQAEGDPAIKGKLRQLRMSRQRKRMMAQVPKAAVVITNPTHYAVALQYERGMEAPICVAKGADAVALKIREIAGEHRIPIVENPPLARALHATVEIDQAIPPEHYKAVAEVIGYVMRLRRPAPH